MDKQHLKNRIEQYVSLTRQEWAEIEPLFKHKTVSRNSYFIRPGQICSEFSFITKGGFRVYNLNEQGQEIISWLPFENNFLCEYVSFFSRSPTPEYIQAIEEAELLTITHADMQYLYDRLPKWGQFGRLLAEETLVHVKHYVLSLIRESAEDRYRRLMEDSPELIRRVPLKYIASLIGVTDTSLSRIRRNFAQ